jgi:hypothetical protein
MFLGDQSARPTRSRYYRGGLHFDEDDDYYSEDTSGDEDDQFETGDEDDNTEEDDGMDVIENRDHPNQTNFMELLLSANPSLLPLLRSIVEGVDDSPIATRTRRSRRGGS